MSARLIEVLRWKYPGSEFTVAVQADGTETFTWKSPSPAPTAQEIAQARLDYDAASAGKEQQVIRLFADPRFKVLVRWIGQLHSLTPAQSRQQVMQIARNILD